MTYSIRKIVVHDQALFLPGGDINVWLNTVKQQVEFGITRECPIGHRPNKTDGTGPGHLASTIFADLTRVGLRQATIVAGADADYTIYVVKGTSRIYSRNELGQFTEAGFGRGGMFLPANPGYGGDKFRQSVAGQKANNFIVRGWNDAARRHSALRPMKP